MPLPILDCDNDGGGSLGALALEDAWYLTEKERWTVDSGFSSIFHLFAREEKNRLSMKYQRKEDKEGQPESLGNSSCPHDISS